MMVALESPSGMGETPRLQAKPLGGPKGPGFFSWLYRARRAFVGFSRRGEQNPSPSGEGDSMAAPELKPLQDLVLCHAGVLVTAGSSYAL